MTPTVGWNEADYYRASRAARRAWQATNAQLEIGGLDEGVARAGSDLSLAAAPSSSPSESGLAAEEKTEDFSRSGAGAPTGLSDGITRSSAASPPAAAPSPRAGSTSKHTNGDAAPVPSDERGIPEKGA